MQEENIAIIFVVIAAIGAVIIFIIHTAYHLHEVSVRKKELKRSAWLRLELRLWTKSDGLLVQSLIGAQRLMWLEFKRDETLDEIYDLIIQVGVKFENGLDYSEEIERIKQLTDIVG